MLAPGDYLINPTSEAQRVTPPAERFREPTPPAPPTPVVEAEEAEPRSFLLILLRALGAIHS